MVVFCLLLAFYLVSDPLYMLLLLAALGLFALDVNEVVLLKIVICILLILIRGYRVARALRAILDRATRNWLRNGFLRNVTFLLLLASDRILIVRTFGFRLQLSLLLEPFLFSDRTQ